jgi:hypothetical protein
MVMSHSKMEEEVLEEIEWCLQPKVKVRIKVKVKKFSQWFIKYNWLKACGRENL